MLTINGKDRSDWRGSDVLCDWVRALGLEPHAVHDLAVYGNTVVVVEFCDDVTHHPRGGKHAHHGDCDLGVICAGHLVLGCRTSGPCLREPRRIRLSVPVPPPLRV